MRVTKYVSVCNCKGHKGQHITTSLTFHIDNEDEAIELDEILNALEEATIRNGGKKTESTVNMEAIEKVKQSAARN